MKKSKILKSIMMVTLGLCLVACGPSAGKLSEAEEARDLLLKTKQDTENTYLDITDSSNKEKLDELSAKAAEIEAMDFKKLNDKKLEEILPTINEVTGQYQSMRTDMTSILAKENSQRAEKGKHVQRDVYFINRTGMNLTSVVLHDLTKDSYGDNYLGDGVTLVDGYTLMGVTLDVYSDSSEWEFIITDEGGTEHALTCGSIKDLDPNGVTIVLEYDSGAKEGTADFPTKEELEEESADETDEIPEEAAEESSGE